MKKFIGNALLLTVAFISGCASTPTTSTYQGNSVTAINGADMTCSQPYALTQDCSIFTAATRRIGLNGKLMKVSGSQDGRIVLVMTESYSPTKQQVEVSADAVQAVATGVGAKLMRIEAMAIGNSVLGYIMHFDLDVYTAIKKSSL